MTIKRKVNREKPSPVVKTARAKRHFMKNTPLMFYGVLSLAFVLAVMGGMLTAPYVIPHVPYLKQIEGYKSPTVYKYGMDCTNFFKEHLI